MTIDLKSLGEKLTRYREQLTESIDEVSGATGIATDRLSAIEAGALEATGDEVLILADHYRCDYKFFISNERVAPFDETETLYRAHGSDFSKSDRRAIQDFLYLCETEAFLLHELGRAGIDFTYVPVSSNHKRNGEHAAAALRAALGYSDNEVPRNVYEEFRRAGVHVFRRKLGNSNISGLFIKHPVAGKCALINYSEDIYRQRFSAAHEMGHALCDVDQVASVSYVRQDGLDYREVGANRFASCFLMPPAFLTKLPSPSRWTDADAVHWANELRVSCQALGIALKSANLIDETAYRRISGLRVPRDAKLDPEFPQSLSSTQLERKRHLLELGLSDFYVGLCFDALHEGVISIGRLAEAFLCSQAELMDIATIYGRTLHVAH